MTDLPEPLTSPGCDLQGYQFMPLDVSRLKGSELASSHTPEACWAALLLWCASWHQVPAGSIPDDEMWIATQAGYALRGKIDRAWKGVRAGAMHGWVKCSDGLLYHPVVAEKALEGWIGKLISSLSGTTGNAKRWGHQVDVEEIKAQIIDAAARLKAVSPQSDMLKKKQVHSIVVGSPPDQNSIAPRSENASPPDGKNIAPRQLNLSPPDRNRDGDGEGDIKTLKTTRASTSVGDASPAKRVDSILPNKAETPNRNVAISVLLRSLGVRPMTAMHPLAVEWAGNPKVTDELLTEAMADAREYKPKEHVSPNYLKPIVDTKLNPPPAREDSSWRRTHEGIDAKARELGLTAHERTYDEFAERIARTIKERKAQQQKPDQGEAA